MKRSLNFICNNTTITTDLPSGTTVLDFLREHQHLTGTKAACREGDCGSCTVLVGRLNEKTGSVDYEAVTSCLLPLGDMDGKHVVSIEGINPGMESTMDEIPVTPVQQLFIDEGATQCGFCTPGFVISLTAFLLREEILTEEKGLEAVSGNICRCTGYGSIKRCIGRLVEEYAGKLGKGKDRLSVLMEDEIVPSYFKGIPERLREINERNSREEPRSDESPLLVAGGTDLYVQKPEILAASRPRFVSRLPEIRGVSRNGNTIRIGAGTPMEELKNDPILNECIPRFSSFLGLIASKQLRRRATVGGNMVNASPIGDLSVFFLGMDARAGIKGGTIRTLPLRELYLAYKKLDLQLEEVLFYIEITVPGADTHINFEKVSRRTHLDIASVNSAVRLTTEANNGAAVIKEIFLSAGGVAPVPLYLAGTAGYLTGKELSPRTVREAAAVADGEISPIDDVRGSARYKRLLLRQLLFAHFITLFPELFAEGGLV